MAFKTKVSLSTDVTIRLGGRDKQTGKPNPTQIEGYFLGSKNTESDYGPGKLHFFQTEKGVVGVWGKTAMNHLLTSDLTGQMVRVTFTGMSVPKKGRNPAYLFRVEHDDENTMDVSGFDPNAGEEPSSEDTGATDDAAYDAPEDTLDDDRPADEVAPVRPSAPARRPGACAAPSADAQAKARALLGNRKSS